MAISIELPPDVETRLREKAEARGLSVEGYLLTLVEVLVQPGKPSRPQARLYQRALLWLRNKPPNPEDQESANPDKIVAETVHQMRERLLDYKEQAVEAVARMNMLRSVLDQQERLAAEAELKAVCALKADQSEQARRLFQEATIRNRHIETVKQELAAATEAAAEITRVFQQEEQQVQKRASQAQATALKALQKITLTSEQIQKLIPRLQTQAEWDQAFEQWVRQRTQVEPVPIGEDDLGAAFSEPDLKAFKQVTKEWAKETKRKPKIK